MIGAWVEEACLVATVALPLAGAALVKARDDAWAGIGVSWTGAMASIAVLMLVVARGPAHIGLGGPSGKPWVGLVANPVTAALLVLICGVGALVQSFQSRYLQADPGSARFAARALLVVSAMATVTASATLAGLICAWVAAGVAFVAVLAYRRDLPGAEASVRTAMRALVLGDSCLLTAGALIWIRAGNVTLIRTAALGRVAHQLGDWRGAVALLVTVAALSRCAQASFRRWLVLTVSAPTPSSALLHAGVVNGGGILLVRLGVVAAWPPAMAALLVLSAATAVWAGAVMSVQADVKGRLVSSTASQMGFMLAEVAVGAWPAAVIHMIGHGFYKSSMFLSSGSAVERPGTRRVRAVRLTGGGLMAGALTVAAGTAAVAPGVIAGDGWPVAIYACLGAAFLGASWWTRRPPGGMARWAWPAALVAAAGAYGSAVAVAASFLGAALPRSTSLGSMWLLGLALVAAIGTLLTRAGAPGTSLRLRLLNAGVPTAPGGRSPTGSILTGASVWSAVARPAARQTEAA